MSSTTKRPPKGILKKTKSTPPPPSQDDAKEIALRHATIIQSRKDLEDNITESIIRLTELPLVKDPQYTASNPASSDVAEFKALVRIFQPTDYDDLIEERNTCGLCGYSLCGNPRLNFKGKGEWKLVNVGRKDWGIVQKKELEKWCSQECARRALYVKVQLSETAAWERVGIPNIQIDLLDEEETDTSPENQLARDVARLKLEEERRVTKDTNSLALERGDTSKKSKKDLVDIEIVEKRVKIAPTAPTLGSEGPAEDSTHLILEGHRTKFTGGQNSMVN